MRYVRSKRYKTDRKNPTGLAVCDFCGFNCNGGKLHKYFQYSGAPWPDYSVENKFMLPTDVMGDGKLIWTGFMVCWHCLDKPNPQSIYVKPKGDPYPADGNRPQPSLVPQVNMDLSTENNIPFITNGGEGEPLYTDDGQQITTLDGESLITDSGTSDGQHTFQA